LKSGLDEYPKGIYFIAMNTKGLIISILAILAVFGLLFLGFLLYPLYRFHRAKGAFERGDPESVYILVSMPKRFESYLEYRMYNPPDNETLLLGDTYYKAQEADKDIPELKEFSEKAYAVYWFLKMYHDYGKKNKSHFLFERKAEEFYPRYGLADRYRKMMFEHEDEGARCYAAWTIIYKNPLEFGYELFAKAFEKGCINAYNFRLCYMLDNGTKRFAELLTIHLEKKGRRGLMRWSCLFEPYSGIPANDKNYGKLGKAIDKVFLAPETVLYFDNGFRVSGEVISDKEDELAFLVYGSEERTIRIQKTAFYRVCENVPIKENPEYNKLHALFYGPPSSVTAYWTWLHSHQDRPEGFWDNDDFMKNCNAGTCDGPGHPDFDVGATGLALRYFFEERNTHRLGPFKKTVRRGLRFLVKSQHNGIYMKDNVSYIPLQHAIATLVTTEAYERTGDGRLKRMSQAASVELVKMRNADGGWPLKKGGTSSAVATAFAVQALRMNVSADMNASETIINDGVKALKSLSNKKESLLSSAGLAAVRILGTLWSGETGNSSSVIKAVPLMRSMLEKPDTDNPTFYLDLYFVTCAMRELGGDEWASWKTAACELLDNLERKDKNKCVAGSFDPPSGKGPFSGRVVSTALACYVKSACTPEIEKYKKLFQGVPELDPQRKIRELPSYWFLMFYSIRYAPYWDIRARAAFILGKVKSFPESAVERLIKTALNDTDAFVRANAVRALGNIGAKDAAAAIVKLKDDKSPFVRAMVGEALEKLE
jgi:hypothetical protein